MQPSTEGRSGLCPGEDEIAAFARGAVEAARVPELELHVDRCIACRNAFAEAVSVSVRQPGTPRRPFSREPSTFEAGKIVAGRYRIIRFIARGGMGEVYEAEDTALGQVIALKCVALTSADDSRALERVRAEVQLARKVTHPGVCRVFDLGLSDEGLFLTMELLPGETLGSRVRRAGRVPTGEAAALVPQMVAALAAAHDVGVVHRDLKSDNVMLVPVAGGQTRVVVLDFGLARETSGGSLSSSLSVDGRRLVGSVAYMSPEQVEGRVATPSSDLYALGVVMFEMLTGALPFQGSTPLAMGARRLSEEAPRARSLVASLDQRWDDVIARCLQRSPGERFAHVREVARALSAPARPAARRSRQGRMRRYAQVGIPAALMFAAAGWFLRPSPPAVRTASHPSPPPLGPVAQPARGSSAAATPPAATPPPLPGARSRGRPRPLKRPDALGAPATPPAVAPAARSARHRDDPIDPFESWR